MSTKQHKLEKKPVIGIVICFFLIICLHILDSYLPDSRPIHIKRTLARQGYDVEHVEFEFIRNGDRFRERIFESSVPFMINGEPVSQWSVVSYSTVIGSPIIYYHVKPYSP